MVDGKVVVVVAVKTIVAVVMMVVLMVLGRMMRVITARPKDVQYRNYY